jgi:hypothetical protein
VFSLGHALNSHLGYGVGGMHQTLFRRAEASKCGRQFQQLR